MSETLRTGDGQEYPALSLDTSPMPHTVEIDGYDVGLSESSYLRFISSEDLLVQEDQQ
jgi:hypothetical protein